MNMKSTHVSGFFNAKWLDKARRYISNPLKMKQLLSQIKIYLTKDGLLKVKDYLNLMYHYVNDIFRGRYTNYHKGKLLLIVGVLIYVVSPMDFLPDMLPAGLIDDSSLILWAIKEASEELENYKKNKEQSEVES